MFRRGDTLGPDTDAGRIARIGVLLTGAIVVVITLVYCAVDVIVALVNLAQGDLGNAFARSVIALIEATVAWLMTKVLVKALEFFEKELQ